MVEVHEDEIDADDEHHPKPEPKPKGRLMDREEAHALHEQWESRNASRNASQNVSRNASVTTSPVGSMRLDRNEILLAQLEAAAQREQPVAEPAPEEPQGQPTMEAATGSEGPEDVQDDDDPQETTTETEHIDNNGAEGSPQGRDQRQSSVSNDGPRDSAVYEETDLVDASPRPSEDCDEGEGRASLTLDVASVHTTTESTPRSRPNSLQRHDSQRHDRTVSPMRSPLTRQLSSVGSHYQYKRGGDSWIKSTTIEASAAAASPVSVTPVRHALPKKIIPVADDQQPLALRSGNKINECESVFQLFAHTMLSIPLVSELKCNGTLPTCDHTDERGVLAEKEKVSSRLQETRLKNITDVVARVLLDGDAAEVPAEIDPTQLLVNPNIDVKKKAIVKQMAMKFGAGAGGAAVGATALDSPRPEDAAEGAAESGAVDEQAEEHGVSEAAVDVEVTAES